MGWRYLNYQASRPYKLNLSKRKKKDTILNNSAYVLEIIPVFCLARTKVNRNPDNENSH